MSNLVAVLTAYRAHYIEFYSAAIEQYREKYEPSAPEVLLEVGGRENRPYPFRLYRMDLASGAVDPPNLTEVNHNVLPAGEVAEFEFDGMTVSLEPIMWNGVEFNCASFDPEADSFQKWILKWIDPDESNQPNEIGLGEYIHSVTWPEQSQSRASFSVDFGSAQTLAFTELLQVLSGFGLKQIEVNSSWFQNK